MAQRRRHGEKLESDILDAAWLELTRHGYAGTTVSGIAERAGTAKTVLYRRWPDKASLLVAAVRAHLPDLQPVGRSGELRADLVDCLRRFEGSLRHLEVFTDVDPELVHRLRTVRQEEALAQVRDVLSAHGIDPQRCSPVVLAAPIQMTLAQAMVGGRTDPEAVVDEVLIPLIVST